MAIRSTRTGRPSAFAQRRGLPFGDEVVDSLLSAVTVSSSAIALGSLSKRTRIRVQVLGSGSAGIYVSPDQATVATSGLYIAPGSSEDFAPGGAALYAVRSAGSDASVRLWETAE